MSLYTKMRDRLRSHGSKAGRKDYGMFLSNKEGDEIADKIDRLLDMLDTCEALIIEEATPGHRKRAAEALAAIAEIKGEE